MFMGQRLASGQACPRLSHCASRWPMSAQNRVIVSRSSARSPQGDDFVEHGGQVIDLIDQVLHRLQHVRRVIVNPSQRQMRR